MGTRVRVCNVGMGENLIVGTRVRVCNVGMGEYLKVETRVRVCNVGMGGEFESGSKSIVQHLPNLL